MVKSTFSLGGKLLTIFLTLVIFIGAIAGTLVVVYKNVKVRTLAGMLGGENWISEEYDDTIEGFVKKVTEALSGDISLNTLIGISPKVGEMLDGVVSNVEEIGLFKIDRDTLYATPVNEISANVMDMVILTASLNDVSEFAGFALPDMPLITGSKETPVDIYTKANGTEDGSIDKVFTMSGAAYEYYTRAVQMLSTYTVQGEDGTQTDADVIQWQERAHYRLAGITRDGSALSLGNARLYIGRTTGSGTSYIPLNEGNDAVLGSTADAQPGEGEAQKYTYTFALAGNEKLYVRTAATAEHEDGYREITDADGLEATGETSYVSTVAAPYRYTALYAQVNERPSEGTEGTDYYAVDGKFYVPANVLGEDGNPVVDEDNGGFAIKGDYDDQPLYYLNYAYTSADASAADAETELFVKTNGIGGLPLIYGMNALSSMLDMQTMTFEKVGEYFGISTDGAVFDTVKYVPFDYLSSSMTAELNSVYVDDVLDIDGTSPRLLLVLAYGQNVKVNDDFTIEYDEDDRRTIGDLTREFDQLTISDMIDIDENSHPLLSAIGDWTMDDIGSKDKINSLTLGDLLGEESQNAKILQALANVSIGEISEEINNISVGDMIEIGENDTLLNSLRGSTLQTLAEDLRSMTVQQMFADSIYNYYEAGSITPSEAQDPATANREDAAALQALFDEKAAVYGGDSLYVSYEGSYMPASEFLARYESGEEDSISGSVPAVLYSKYLLLDRTGATETTADDLANYASGNTAYVPLYAFVDGKMTEITENAGWSLSAEDKVELSGKTLYVRATDADGSPVTGENGEPLYKEAEDNNGVYAESELWYFDNASERMRKVTLEPAGLELAGTYENIFARLTYAGTYSAENPDAVYSSGNLFRYDAASESWKQVAVTHTGSAANQDLAYTVSGTVADGTRLYTYGNVTGIWKYLLTDEDGAEVSCAVQSVDTLISNVRANINRLTLKVLYQDGMIDISDPALLTTDIPAEIASSYPGAAEVGDLTLNQLLDLTLKLLQSIPSGS